MPLKQFRVENLNSAECCEKVQQAARSVNGVQQARANLKQKTLEVEIAEVEAANAEEPLRQAIEQAGYRLSPQA